MGLPPVSVLETVVRRCKTLLKRENGSKKTTEEYHYWVDWLGEMLKKTRSEKVLKMVEKDKQLYSDIKIKLNIK